MLLRNDPEMANLFSQLERAGFRPLGLVTNTYELDATNWWKRQYGEYFFTGDCLAHSYVVCKGEPRRLGLRTSLSTGLLVETAAQMADLTLRSDHYHRTGVETRQVSVLLAAHRERLQEHLNQGAKVLPTDDLIRIERDVEIEAAAARSLFTDTALLRCKSILGWNALCVALVGLGAGRSLFTISLGIVLGCLIDRVLFEYLTWQTKSQIVADSRLTPW